MKKIFIGIFIGCSFCYIYFYPYESEIGSELSQNKKYKLLYSAEKFGGIFTGSYNHYVRVIDTANNKLLLSYFVESDDIKSRENKAHWNGDTITVKINGFYSNDRKLQKIEVTEEKTVFYFPQGYATK